MHSLHGSIVYYIIKVLLTDNIQLMLLMVSTLIWLRGSVARVFYCFVHRLGSYVCLVQSMAIKAMSSKFSF